MLPLHILRGASQLVTTASKMHMIEQEKKLATQAEQIKRENLALWNYIRDEKDEQAPTDASAWGFGCLMIVIVIMYIVYFINT